MTFEDMMGDNGKARQHACILAVANHVEAQLDGRNVTELLAKLIGKETLTFSGRRSNWRPDWNDDVEQLFIRTGIRDVNRQLGYMDAADGRQRASLSTARRHPFDDRFQGSTSGDAG